MIMVHTTSEVRRWFVDGRGYTLCAVCQSARGESLSRGNDVSVETCDLCGATKSVVIADGACLVETTPCKIF